MLTRSKSKSVQKSSIDSGLTEPTSGVPSGSGERGARPSRPDNATGDDEPENEGFHDNVLEHDDLHDENKKNEHIAVNDAPGAVEAETVASASASTSVSENNNDANTAAEQHTPAEVPSVHTPVRTPEEAINPPLDQRKLLRTPEKNGRAPTPVSPSPVRKYADTPMPQRRRPLDEYDFSAGHYDHVPPANPSSSTKADKGKGKGKEKATGPASPNGDARNGGESATESNVVVDVAGPSAGGSGNLINSPPAGSPPPGPSGYQFGGGGYDPTAALTYHYADVRRRNNSNVWSVSNGRTNGGGSTLYDPSAIQRWVNNAGNAHANGSADYTPSPVPTTDLNAVESAVIAPGPQNHPIPWPPLAQPPRNTTIASPPRANRSPSHSPSSYVYGENWRVPEVIHDCDAEHYPTSEQSSLEVEPEPRQPEPSFNPMRLFWPHCQTGLRIGFPCRVNHIGKNIYVCEFCQGVWNRTPNPK